MRTLYLDCGMGAAGDMLMAALLELVDDKAAFLEKMNGLGLPGVAVSAVPAVKCGITGTHLTVLVAGEEEGDHHPHHHHRGMAEIEALITSLALSPKVREDVLAVYRLLAAAEAHLPLAGCREMTVEAGRPDTITREKLEVLREHGIERISINPQTMSDQVLQAIGRRHTARDIREAFCTAREVDFACINMDLIAGLPQDSVEGFRDSLEEVLALRPENITVHTLAMKKGSRLMEEGGALPSGEETARMVDLSLEALEGAGYRPYYLYRQKYMSGGLENVSWCLPGTENHYNIIMMEELQSVLSLGAGGVTKLVDRSSGRIVRLTNPKYPHDYLAMSAKVLEQKDEILRFYREV